MKRVFLGKTLKFQKSLVRHYRNCNGLTCLGCMWRLWWRGSCEA